MLEPRLRTLAAVLALSAAPATSQWLGWGGPNGNFEVSGVGLAERWPSGGPEILWERELGNGNSAIVVDGVRLFTMTGEGKRERVVALDAESGEPLWEHAYSVSYETRAQYGGPHATPLVIGNALVTVGIDAKVHAFDKASGEVRWMRDLVLDLGVDIPQSGYAASPLGYGDLVILPGQGAPGYGALALRIADGTIAWARHGFLSSHASPRLIRFGDRDHAVFHGTNFLIGLDPVRGDLLWRYRLRTDAIDNVAFGPLWDPERSQFIVSHAYDRAGTQAVQLSGSEGNWHVAEAWTSRRLKVLHGNGVLLDGALYASDGDEPAYMTSLDAASGDRRFKRRGIPKATFLSVDSKLLVLDEEGTLYLARGGGDDLEILARHQVLEPNAWTVPTLVGRRLYLRDRFRIKVLVLP